MDRGVMKLLGVIFVITLPLWILITIVLLVSGSGDAATAKLDGVLGLLAIGSLLGMVGGLILERFEALKERHLEEGPPASPPFGP